MLACDLFSRVFRVTLNSNESPIENNLYIIIKIVLYVTFDVLVGFSSFLDFLICLEKTNI